MHGLETESVYSERKPWRVTRDMRDNQRRANQQAHIVGQWNHSLMVFIYDTSFFDH